MIEVPSKSNPRISKLSPSCRIPPPSPMMNPPTEADEMLQLVPPHSDLAATDEVFEDLPSRFTWDIENFSRSKEKYLFSDPFVAGGYKWQLFIFPKGNNVDHLSLYIQAVDATKLPYGCSIYTKLSLTVVNQMNHSFNATKDTQHEFNSQETNCGFTWFMPLSELYDCDRGYLVNDTCIIEADITVRLSLRSKMETGYVGLKSLWATCYLNSLLQTLYHIPYLKKAVFHMPITGNDMPSGSIHLSFQSLFYNLQYSETSVATEELTKSFGLDTYEDFKRHDVQELSIVLFEKLEEKMKGTVVEGAIQQMFEGHTMISNVDNIYVDTRSRKETFSYLQLDAKGCRNVYESFNKYVEGERPEADIIRYHAEPNGLQDAKKRVLFIDFPPVLLLELKRFDYDCMRDPMFEKINDSYIFPLQLDLDRSDGKYLSPLADRSVRNLYTLYSVWVHSGGEHDRHYFAYIRPMLSDQWFKFDDERVTEVDINRALYEQYGDEEEHQTNPSVNNSSLNYTKNSNAYMLVYIRESEKAKIFCNVDEMDMAEHLRVRLKEDEPHLCTKIKVVHEMNLQQQIGNHIYLDLVDFDVIHCFRIRKHTSFALFQEELAKKLGVPMQYQQFWLWGKRHNIYTYRPYRPLTPHEKAKTVEYIRKFSNKHKNAELHLYLEVDHIGRDLLPIPPVPEKRILLFFKHYDPVKEELRYVVDLVVKGTEMLVDILSTLKSMVGFRQSDEIEVSVEMSSKPYLICLPIDKKLTLEENHLGDGDIICFQKVVHVENLRFPDVLSFMKHVRRSRKFCNRTLPFLLGIKHGDR